MENVEKKVADAILQQPLEVNIGDRVYSVAPPSVATLILASEAVSRMPHIRLNKDDIINESLAAARFCRPIGEFVAILILGAKGIREQRETAENARKRHGFLWRRKTDKAIEVDAKEELTEMLLTELSPKELYELTAQLLQRMQVGDFFGLTTFLIETNLTRTTKVEETTASGR